MKRFVSQQHFFTRVAIPLFAVVMLFGGGLKNLAILCRGGRTTATVTSVWSNGRGRAGLAYSYEVGGHTYTGKGGPDHPAFAPPVAVGDTFEVRYSTWLPFFSTAQNPVTIFGQFAVGCLFLLWADFMSKRYGKKQKAKELTTSEI